MSRNSKVSVSAVRCATPRGSMKGRREKKSAHKGWLQKRGPLQSWEWVDRFCVMTEDEIVFYTDDSERPEARKGELFLTEYTKAIEFKKSDAPGEAAKHVKERPFGFVVDMEPHAGKHRQLYYFSADSLEKMNAWIVGIYKVTKQLKNLAPSNRTSLADFVALWDAAIVVVSAPEIGEDKTNVPRLSVPTLCQRVLNESATRSAKQQTGLGAALDVVGGWFSTGDTEREPEKTAFPLHKYFTISVDYTKGSSFCESRIRVATDGGGVVTGAQDFDANYEAAFKDRKTWSEEVRQSLAIENSFSLCHWRGMVFGSLMQAMVAASDKDIPPVDKEIDTKIGKMSQAGAQGLFIADPRTAKGLQRSMTVRVVVAVSIDGGTKEEIQQSYIPSTCKEVIEELKKEQYPWAADAWMVWCRFGYCEDFLRSLVGCRNLVPDNVVANLIREDHTPKPTTYTVTRYRRMPSAPSLLGDADVEDILSEAASVMVRMVEDLLDACDSKNLKKAKSILDARCDVNAKDDTGLSAVHVSAGLGHTAMVSELVSRRADINVTDAEGDTVLTVATCEGHLDVVKILVANGADTKVAVAGQWIDEPNKDITLIEAAQKRGFPEVAKFLSLNEPQTKNNEPKEGTPKTEKGNEEQVANKAAAPAPTRSRIKKTGTSLADELEMGDVS